MTLLDNHLEQISLSSAAIAELAFPAPKIFTNSLLHSHDITSLIRDTEAHERALFTVTPSDPPTVGVPRRSTVYRPDATTEPSANGAGLMRRQKQRTTVATLLGGELGEQIRKEGAKEGIERGEVDVNLLLKGAEKLCGVYPVSGAPERIVSLRSRYDQLNSSIARYESKVAKQMIELEKMNRHKDGNGNYDDQDEDLDLEADDDGTQTILVTEEDLRREDEEIRELEKKKRGLEDRVSGMERDLGGLLR